MAVQEDPELIYAHEPTKTATTYSATHSEKALKTNRTASPELKR